MTCCRVILALLMIMTFSSQAHDIGFLKVTQGATDDFPIGVLYPTSAKPTPIRFGPITLSLAMNGAIKEGRFPLVVLSHGSGGSGLSYKDIALALVRRGFIVALPSHPHNNYLDNTIAGQIENYINRPKNISAAIDKVLAIPNLHVHVDVAKIAVLGHSVGGYTSLVVSGAIAKTKSLVDLCHHFPKLNDPYCAAVHNGSLNPSTTITAKDSRVKAQVLMAPIGALFLAKHAFDQVKIPTLLLVAGQDEELTEQYNARVIEKGLEKTGLLTYHVIENAGHYSFLTAYPDAVKAKLGVIAKDPKGFDRVEFQKHIGNQIASYLIHVFSLHTQLAN
ncbi:MAG: alpha/beta hydrolase family protein [Vibrio sp.]